MTSPASSPAQIRIYRVLDGDLNSDTPLKLELVRKTHTVPEARKWLKSRECFMEQIRDRHVSQAEFLIIPEKDHYRLMPVTVVIAENLAETSPSSHSKPDHPIKGMRLNPE